MRADAEAIHALLPHTQCTRCGYAGCRPYAEAIAAGDAEINRCPPGGAETLLQLATLLRRPPLPLDPACGIEGPALLAIIDEARCIGCARCLPPCPVDAIIGAPRQLHTVLNESCTGCALCLPPCPVDCITLVPRTALQPATAAPQPSKNLQRHAAHERRRAERAAGRQQLLEERKQRAASAQGCEPPAHGAAR